VTGHLLRITLVAGFVALLHHGLPGAAHAGPRAARTFDAQDRPLFSTESDLVVLHVNVRDKKGAYVTGLTEDAFAVLEDGHPQATRFFTHEDSPVTVGLLIDSSGSMLPNRDRVIAAATAFAQASNPDDELFALAFNETVRAAFPPTAPFTSDPVELSRAVTDVIHTHGRTALFDAIAAGVDYLDRGHHERKVLVLVSDGGDNASHATLDEVLTTTETTNVVIYTVALVDPLERDANPKLLKRIAEASGGEAFAPGNSAEMTRVLERIARDIRETYTVGYVSSNEARDGSFRQIRVIVHAPDRRPLIVRARGGYLAGPRKPKIGSADRSDVESNEHALDVR
jgi:Ca-activated chloride channel family protein